MNPTVSVYIPTRNRLNLLKRAVHSVLWQTFRDIELIVVIDGSEDESNEFINSVSSDIPVKVISNFKPFGACEARNQAIEAAGGKFVTGLDDDDWFRPDRIELFVGKWKACSSAGRDFSALCDATVAIRDKEVLTWSWSDEIDLKQIRVANVVGSQIFTLRQRYHECGLFDPDMPAWQDWDLWIRMIERYGSAVNLKQGTYFADQLHQQPRITTKNSTEIRRAYELFADKHKFSSLRELAPLLLAYSRYPQAKLGLKDIMILFAAFHVGSAVRCLRRGQLSLRWYPDVY